MKKTYEKPTIVKREVVQSITARTRKVKLTVSMIPEIESYSTLYIAG